MQTIKIKTEIKAVQSEEFTIPEKVAVYTDKKTGVKTIAIPMSFPNGENGIISITKLVKLGWVPSVDIESVVINFK